MGKGRHKPYQKRSKKKLTIHNVKVLISEGKLKLFPILMYCFLDYLQDGALDGSLLVSGLT